MSGLLKRHLTYANVMATIAVVLALGGVSWAASKAPKNSVGTAAIKRNAVTSGKIRNKTLRSSDFKPAFLNRKWPQAGRADSAARADLAAKADLASKADLAAKATQATNAVSATSLENTFRGYERVAATQSTVSKDDAFSKAPEISLAKRGGVEIFAKCAYYNSVTYSRIGAHVSQANTLIQSGLNIVAAAAGSSPNLGADGQKSGPGGAVAGHSGVVIEPDGSGISLGSLEGLSSTYVATPHIADLPRPNAFPDKWGCIFTYEGRYLTP